MEKKRKEMDEAKKRQAEQAEKSRQEKEKERKLHKEKESKWLEVGIQAKTNLNKSLISRQKAVVDGAKGKAMADCFVLWQNDEKAGDYGKAEYIDYIKSIQSEEDAKYSNIVQINAAVGNGPKSWEILKAMIQTLL